MPRRPGLDREDHRPVDTPPPSAIRPRRQELMDDIRRVRPDVPAARLPRRLRPFPGFPRSSCRPRSSWTSGDRFEAKEHEITGGRGIRGPGRRSSPAWRSASASATWRVSRRNDQQGSNARLTPSFFSISIPAKGGPDAEETPPRPGLHLLHRDVGARRLLHAHGHPRPLHGQGPGLVRRPQGRFLTGSSWPSAISCRFSAAGSATRSSARSGRSGPAPSSWPSATSGLAVSGPGRVTTFYFGLLLIGLGHGHLQGQHGRPRRQPLRRTSPSSRTPGTTSSTWASTWGPWSPRSWPRSTTPSSTATTSRSGSPPSGMVFALIIFRAGEPALRPVDCKLGTGGTAAPKAAGGYRFPRRLPCRRQAGGTPAHRHPGHPLPHRHLLLGRLLPELLRPDPLRRALDRSS